MTTHVPVLICGGGRRIIKKEMLLRRDGVFPVLVEKHAGSARQPKARRFNPRSTEIFRLLGLANEVAEASAPLASFSEVLSGPTLAEARPPELNGTMRELREQMARMSELSPGPNVLCPQSVLEPLLRRAAEERGVSVRLGTELVSFTQDDSG